MTIIAGLFSYHGEALEEDLCRSIRSAISRDPEDQRPDFRSALCYLVKVDIGAYGESAFERRGRASAAVLAGDPLLPPDGNERSRTADLSRLHDGWLASDASLLRAAHGSFCVAHYSDHPPRLTLVADKLAARPLYCWRHSGLVVFASALRILEGMVRLRKTVDTRGLCEQLSFGYPLGDRTAYQEIRRLCASEVVTYGPEGERRVHYWRWDSLPNASLDPAAAPVRVRDALTQAVARRLKPGEESVAAFLSGGLDSRLVTTILKDYVRNMYTFTFADNESMDGFLAREYAQRLGSRHHAYPSIEANTHPSTAYGEHVTSFDRASPERPDRPQIVWSGDGGSVCLGYVYLNNSMVKLSRHNLEKEAIREFLIFNRRGLATRKIFGRIFSHISQDFVSDTMKCETDMLTCRDPAMKLYTFLLINDQSRHLSDHYELIDVHRTELHLPFFDTDVLELMLCLPIENGLYHKFYYDMLNCLPPIVTGVPWQAYPGHLPCPLPAPPGLIDQWQWSKECRSRTKGRGHQLGSVIRWRDAYGVVLDKKQVYLASLLTRFGLGDRACLIEAAGDIYRHWSLCRASMDGETSKSARTKGRLGTVIGLAKMR